MAEFERRDRFFLALMPAGSRATPDSWRSGFYYIARDAGVPMFLVGFDWGTRTIASGRCCTRSPNPRTRTRSRGSAGSFDGLTGRRDGDACAPA